MFFLINAYIIFFFLKGALSGLRHFLAIESSLKISKNAFYYTSKALFVINIFKFLSSGFGNVAKQLDQGSFKNDVTTKMSTPLPPMSLLITYFSIKKLLSRQLLFFTSIYFESDCKIPAGSNKSISQSFYHKTHLYTKGILNENKQI